MTQFPIKMPKMMACCKPKRRSNPIEDVQIDNDVFDEEFQCYMRVAKSLMKTLKRQKDVEIFTQILKQVTKLNKCENMEVKKHTNTYFKFFLKVLNWTSANQPLKIYKKWYRTSEKTETKMWMDEQKSYFAIKSMCDGSILIYSAMARDPCAGWVDGGLKALQDMCEKK